MSQCTNPTSFPSCFQCRQGVEEDAKGHYQEECTRCRCSQSRQGRQGCNEGPKAYAKSRTQSRWKTINTSSVVSNVIKTKIRLFVKNFQVSLFFSAKIQLWFPEKIVDFFGVKNSWKCCGFGLFSCWQLWFHEKNCQKDFGWKTRENGGDLSKLNFWKKIWLYE